ncbi:flagellar biosynthetic protein FlhB [Massilia arenosa]|uniref:Flagellar biosynthetic protein FlhB n=1 Tax=Zemynaea arenosa TaxID=2561931 RepID=A0A4Y9STQ5_9BURK|nr:EscU/YscU/HrcU family type III secretion system export apparatus switch protein [Massilia arenosa]TFW30182.1 flagellar biosynthetic protein FlhB [Massilia arenosa]
MADQNGNHGGRNPGPPPRTPPASAVALAYADGDVAPKVVAKGKGQVASQIIARAQEHGVFVHESKELVSLLMHIDLDRQIPPALYRIVAELLAWLYHIESAQQSGGVMPAPPDAATLIEPNSASNDATT